MSQHDFTIGNQLFPATRTDLNSALVALASNSSGTTEPSTTYANQWWYETDTNTLKIRNEADSAWIEIAVLDQSANNVLSITTQGLTLAGTAITATGAELNKLSGATVTAAELNKLSGATVTTAELNKLSGATVTAAELNKLAGATVTTAELNKLNGITRGSIMYGSAAGTALLPKGTSGQVLSATATDIAWITSIPAITSDGANPSLSSNITGAEIRTLIGAGEPYTHPNHSGEVTSTADGATVIADNVVDEANLKVSNTPTNGYVLTAESGNTGGLTWAELAEGSDTIYTHPNHTGEVTSSGDGATVVASNVIDADNLNVTGNGTTAQFLRSDGDGSFTWATPVDTDTVYTHPNHSGEVTSTADGATVIASNVVDADNLNVTGNGTTSQFLRSDGDGSFTWAAAGAASTTLGAVGTYAQMQNNSGTATIAAGSTIAGSGLLYHNLNYSVAGTPAASGTWRVMGRYLSSGTGSLNGISVCVRIS